MKPKPLLWIVPALPLLLWSCSSSPPGTPAAKKPLVIYSHAQVPAWSDADAGFFLHGTMSTEVVPENVLHAFVHAYPDLFPAHDLSNFGLIPDANFGWPIGFSRRKVPHLGNLSSVGLNCAACHAGAVRPRAETSELIVLGMTSQFDAEAFFGAVAIATFRTSEPADMKKFLSAYLAANGSPDDDAQKKFEAQWLRQEKEIAAALAADPVGAKDVAPGALQSLTEAELRFDQHRLAEGVDLAALSHSMLKLFHNMRAALHIPDQLPDHAPTPSGPGRNDAFGLLSAVLFHEPQPYAPVKYGLVWNVAGRPWVHWDGNTQSPLGRNLLASLGLGAPLIGTHGELDFAAVKHQTDLSEHIRPLRYPFAIDDTAARRGAALYQGRCASCHDGPETNARLHAASEVGTDARRADLFTPLQAERFNKFLAGLETPGYSPSAEPGIRSTQKYFAPTLAGVWARSPYLHNGSVRSMQELLTPPAARAKSFQRGTRVYDETALGYADAGSYRLDTTIAGNANTGHDYGTDLSREEKLALIEYLKTL